MLLTLALGTNLGDRHQILAEARRRIGERIGPLVQESATLETKAWGVEDQPDFLNQVIFVDGTAFFGANAGAGNASVPALLHRLLDLTQAIEAELGRERTTHWGPRTCDIDLIFVGDIRYEDERVSIPHPWWRERAFVAGLIEKDLEVRHFGKLLKPNSDLSINP